MSKLPFSHALVLRYSALGDVALTTGVLQHWYALWGLRFTVLTKEAFAPLFQGHHAVDEVLCPTPGQLHGLEQWHFFRSLVSRFANMPLIDLHGTLRSRQLATLWKGPVFSYPKHAVARRVFLASRGRWGGSCLQHSVSQRYAMALENFLTPEEHSLLLPQMLRPQVFLEKAEQEDTKALLQQAWRPQVSEIPEKSETLTMAPIALHPYATYAGKLWPHWQQLCALLRQKKLPYIVVGQSQHILAEPGNITNQTSLRQLCAVLAACSMLITGDSGPMHLSCAVNTPVLALFGPTCREWGFFPAGERVLQKPMPCRPCTLHGKKPCASPVPCMQGISSAEVLEACLDMLQRRGKKYS